MFLSGLSFSLKSFSKLNLVGRSRICGFHHIGIRRVRLPAIVEGSTHPRREDGFALSLRKSPNAISESHPTSCGLVPTDSTTILYRRIYPWSYLREWITSKLRKGVEGRNSVLEVVIRKFWQNLKCRSFRREAFYAFHDMHYQSLVNEGPKKLRTFWPSQAIASQSWNV